MCVPREERNDKKVQKTKGLEKKKLYQAKHILTVRI
jgi:hypothetical protein